MLINWLPDQGFYEDCQAPARVSAVRGQAIELVESFPTPFYATEVIQSGPARATLLPPT